MSRAPIDFAAKARAAWGDALPDWIEAIADEATRTTASAVAARLGYSAPVISEVLANRYRGDVAGVEQAVRGVYLGAVVACPVLGELGTMRCREEQAKPFMATSSVRTRLYRACRDGCPHSRITGGEK